MGFYKTTITNREGELAEVGGIQSIFLHGEWHMIPKGAISTVDYYIEQSHQIPIFSVFYIEPTSKGDYMLKNKLWAREQSEEKFKEHLTMWVLEKLIAGCRFDFDQNVDMKDF